MIRLKKEGFVTLKELFIDGTKIEANANRYTFLYGVEALIIIWQVYWILSRSFIQIIILF